jgi:hypothetical protein
MNVEHKVFSHQFPIVKLFVYHLTYYRVFLKIYKERQRRNEFWTLTIDAHLLRALTNWCMVFGSDRSEPTHWKRLSISNSDELNINFREGLFRATGLSPHTWERYWQDVVNFRNKFAVHRELEFNEPVPVFDTALAVVYYYDTWVREVISPDSFDEPPLRLFEKKLSDSMIPVAEALLRDRAGD